MTSAFRQVVLFGLCLLAAPAAMADQPLAVRITTAQIGPVVENYELTGTIEARNSVPLAFRDGGRVLEVLVQVGDPVQRGEVLARVDPTQARAALQAGEAQLGAADAGLTQAQLARDRAADLLARGAGTRANLDSAEEALLAAQSARDQASAQLEKAQQAIDDTEVIAPVTGIVTSRSTEPGEIAGPAQPILTIAPDGDREVIFYGPSVAQVDSLLGREIRVSPINMPELEIPATIAEISPLANPDTGTVIVRARLGEGGADVSLGDAATASVMLDEAMAISLPSAALVTSQGQPAVWVVDPQGFSVSLMPIEIADYTSDTVQVASGLPEGALVVTAGSHLLYPGRIVRAAPEAG